MGMGAKWSMGFVLRMHNSQFSAALLQATAGINKLTEAHRQYKRQIESVRATVTKNAIAAAGMFTAVAYMSRGLNRLTQSAKDYQYQAQGVSALLHEQTGTGQKMYIEFRKLNPYIKEFAPKEVVGRMRQLAAAGYSGNEILDSMGAILDAVTASMGELSTTTATELGINLHRAFGDSNTSMRQVLDIAAAAANQYPMSMGQIADAMGYATEAAVQFNQPLEEVLMTIGMLIPVTKTAAKGGTAYRNSLQALAKPKTIEFLTKYGIQVKDANGQMRSQLDIYEDIFKALDKVEKKDKSLLKMEREAIIHQLGGTRGGALFAAQEKMLNYTRGQAGTAIAGRSFATREAAILAQRYGLAGAEGEVKKLADRMRETSYVLDQRLAASAERAGVALGTMLLPIKDRFTKVLINLADWIADLTGGGVTGPGGKGEPIFGGVLGDIIGAGGTSAGVGLLTSGLVLTLSTIGKLVRFLMAPQQWINTAMTAGIGAFARASRNVTLGTRFLSWLGMGRTVPNLGPVGPGGVGPGSSFVMGNMTEWFSKIALVGGVVVGALAYMSQAIKDTAHDLFDFGDKAAAEQAKRFGLVTTAANVFWEKLTHPWTKKDEVRATLGGYMPILAQMFATFQKGATPLEATKQAFTQMGKENAAMFSSPEQAEHLKELNEKLAAEQKQYTEGPGREREAELFSDPELMKKLGISVDQVDAFIARQNLIPKDAYFGVQHRAGESDETWQAHLVRQAIAERREAEYLALHGSPMERELARGKLSSLFGQSGLGIANLGLELMGRKLGVPLERPMSAMYNLDPMLRGLPTEGDIAGGSSMTMAKTSEILQLAYAKAMEQERQRTANAIGTSVANALRLQQTQLPTPAMSMAADPDGGG